MANLPKYLDLLGETVLSKAEPIPTASIATGKNVVGLYFSAHWCPPWFAYTFKILTPKLIEFYATHKETFEIVFCSADKDQEAFDGYFGNMPWLAAPYESIDVWSTIKKYGHNGIPTLLLFDATSGALITAAGAESITSDPLGVHFPYKEKTLREIIDETTFLSAENDGPVAKSQFSGKNIAFFFDGVFDSPAKEKNEEIDVKDPREISLLLRQELLVAYKNKTTEDNFEIVSIFNVKTAEEHAKLSALVPWPVAAFDEKHTANLFLSILLSIDIDEPVVSVLNTSRNILNNNATYAILKHAPIPFRPQLTGDFYHSDTSKNFAMGKAPFLSVFAATASPESITALEKIISNLADSISPPLAINPNAGKIICSPDGTICERIPDAEEEDTSTPKLLFFLLENKSSMYHWLRKYLDLGKEERIDAAIFSFKTSEKYAYTGPITFEGLLAFYNDFSSGKLKQEAEEKKKQKKEAEEKEQAVAAKAVENEKKAKQWIKKITKTTTTVIGNDGKGSNTTIFTRTVFTPVAE
ncbi:hypothetical protein HK100_003267 [Physocladia obscura]|uniref:Thioredoxin-like fold domain-containing protein n=1 Tax=Physocladia obscura TaxID=109957 RepID=A0AAD5SWE8_9FUNG|nr:hypothetical protein HK100_003267 [Physocladia obscura]